MLKKLIGINIILTSILIGLFVSWMFYCIGDPSEFGHISHTYAKLSNTDDTQIVKRIDNATQPVGKIINDNNDSYGTAFIVDDHTIISNSHVTKGDIRKTYFRPQVNTKHLEHAKTIEFTEKHEFKNRDIVIIHTKQSLSQYPHYDVTSQYPKWFEPTTSFGYPYMPKDKNSEFYIHQTTYRFLFHRSERFYVSGTIFHGSSGSPMLNKHGNVYGIATFNYDDENHPSKHKGREISGGQLFTSSDVNFIKQNLK